MTQGTGWRVEVTDECVSSTQCVTTAPDLFVLNDDGYSTPIDELVGPERTDDLRIIVEQCPVGAIRIVSVPLH